MSIQDLSKNELRGISAFVLLVIVILYITKGADNQAIEYIMLGLTAFLVGTAFIGPKNGSEK